MRILPTVTRTYVWVALFTIIIAVGPSLVNAQQKLRISDFVLFGGNSNCPNGAGQTPCNDPGCAVQIASSSKINGGSIGSFKLVKTTGSASIFANIYSGGTVQLATSNTVTGKIAAANSQGLTSTILSVGSSANLGGDIDVNGKIVIGGGTVSGKVTHPDGTSYTGPNLGSREIKGPPTIPVLPDMPSITPFDPAGSTDITSTRTIIPGAYRSISLSGGKTITFSGPGTYIFKNIKNTGNINDFVFDFKNAATGNFLIYIHGDADLNKVSAKMINGGSAARIYTETHGTGSGNSDKSVAFQIANGTAGNGASKWLGSVWSPYAAIYVGSGSGNCDVTGALWSGTQVSVGSNVTVNYAPFLFCTPPNANAGPDKPLDFSGTVTLTGTSTTPSVTYSWQASNGGVISSASNQATITASAAGTYTLTVTTNQGCTNVDEALVTGKQNSIIGSELESVSRNFTPNSPPSPFFVIQDGYILIDIIAKETKYAQVLALLQGPDYGLIDIISNGTSSFIITGRFPIINLTKLNLLTDLINFCRPYYKPFNNSGLVTTAGDAAMRSDFVRNGYKLQGEGIKIGVLSDSYNTITTATTTPIKTNTASQDIGNGDLPGAGNPNGNTIPVNVLRDYPVRSSDEGRAMLQIVHDIAPKASLYFRTGFISPGDFAVGIKELQAAGCNVIVDDITYITEPFLKDGVVANAVDQVAALGASYFSAAGNFANKSYGSVFNPATPPAGLTGSAHNFGGKIFQSVTLKPGDYTIVLQWVDDIYSLGQTATGGTKNDLDIYLATNNGTTRVGYNRNNLGGDPIEIMPFTITAETQSNIMVVNNTSATNNSLLFKYIIFRGDIVINEFYSGTSTITGQANALGAITVGAVRYDKAPPFSGPLAVESFSSIGGTSVNNVVRSKPDFVAPNGGNTTVRLGIDYDNDQYSNFFGTSASAPHAAGAAALIIEGRKKFLNQPATSPSVLRSLLQTTATDIGPAGFDFSSGYGFLNAGNAMQTFASPTPVIEELVVPDGVTPGAASFKLTVKGDFITNQSVIYFRNTALTTTVVNSTEATATIPTFPTGNPSIRVYTTPTSVSGADGGFSNSAFFSDLAKRNITITADSKTKKYAEQLPAYTATVLVDGQPLSSSGLTLQQLGLSTITFTALATSNSDVGTYLITPSRVFDPNNATDLGLLETYNYSFVPGNLTVQKMPLKVTPVDKTVKYGDYIGPVTYTYQYDQSKVPDPSGVLNVIKSYHQAFLPNNTLAVVKDFSKTQANGSVLTTADLLNLNMIASFNAVKNARQFQLQNNKLVPVTNSTSFNLQYVIDVASEVLYNYKLNPSSTSFVNGKAMLSASSLAADNGQVLFNGSLVKLVNGTLVQMVNTNSGPMAPIVNGSLVQLVNATLVQLVNGEPVAVPNTSPIQIINGSLVKLVNGEFEPLVNGSLVKLVNGSLVKLVNGSLVKLVNGQEIPIINGSLVKLVNGTLVQIVNGVEVPIANGSLVKLVNSEVVEMVDGALQQIANGSLVKLVNGSLVRIVNGTLVKIVNGNSIGSGISNSNTAVLFDQADVDLQTNWIGPMFGVNMITGLNAGQQKLIPGVLINENFDITYGLGNVSILATPLVITPKAGQSKKYGDPDPVFTFTNNGGIADADFTGKLGRVAGENVKTYAYTLGNLSAGVNYSLSLSTQYPVATFAITPAPLTVRADDKVIWKGDPLPTFTSTITGLKNGDKPTVTYTLSPSCSGAPGEYAIIPKLSSTFTSTGNYTITLINGTLYINPKGTGAKKLRPYLDCVVMVSNPAPGQFKYIAKFVCENPNSTTVAVAIGTENRLSSQYGTFDGSRQPFVFKPGLTRFEVPFDGNKLTWELTTYESTKKTAVASYASSTSSRCSSTSSRGTTSVKETNETGGEVVPGIGVYPNPAKEKVIIRLEEKITARGTTMFDASGRAYPVRVSRTISDHSFELNISGQAQGLYLLRVKTVNGYRTVRIIKE